MDRQTRQQRAFEGWEVRDARTDRRERGGRTLEEARKLIYQAARDCSICAVCFQPLAPWDSVTMEWRQFGYYTLHTVRVPVCLTCTLGALKPSVWWLRLDHPTYDGADWKRIRCRHCDRPLRIANSNPPASPTCCKTCQRLDRNSRNKLRRRVKHKPMTCIECGETFIPKRADAVTCSNKCRQAQHRKRVGAAIA
jgi:hypothetical protein